MRLVFNDTSHSYWLDGKRVKSASAVAKIAADSFSIEQWSLRQIAIGMTLDRALAERVAVDLDNREAIQKVCDDAKTAAKSSARAHRGQQRHRVFELMLLGRKSALVTDQQRNDAKVLERTLDTYGLTAIPDRVEQFVAWPEHGVVGRYDAYLMHEGRPVLVDLKGGINAVKYPHSTAVQLPLYRFAPHTSAAIERDGDRSAVTEWTTAPDGADEEIAYVLHCDDDHEVGELWRIDLVAGRVGAELALAIVDWRKSKNYGKALATPIPVDFDEIEFERQQEEEPEISSAESDVREASVGLPTGFCSAEEPVAAGPPPAGERPVPEAAASGTAEQLAAVRRRGHQLPDEGAAADPVAVVVLRQQFDALPPDAKAWVAGLTRQAREAGVDWRISAKATVRRYELGRAVVALAAHHQLDYIADIIRGLAYSATDREEVAQEAIPLGAALGTLDAGEATRFAQFVMDYLSPKRAA